MAGLTTLTSPPLRIYGRSTQLHAIETLLNGVRAGRGGVLVLAAAPGFGRTTLLAHAARSFRSSRAGTVLSTRADPAESLIPYSGVHSLWCAGGAPRTPPEEPGALLPAVRDLAGGRPLLVCVDDAHLWDAASRAALGFAARRLEGPHPIGLLLSVAAHRADDPRLAALPVLHLDPLAPPDAAALVDDLTRGGAHPVVHEVVREEILGAAGGSPRLVHDLIADLTPHQPAGRAPLPQRLYEADPSPYDSSPSPYDGGPSPFDGSTPAFDGIAPPYSGLEPLELPPDTEAFLLLVAAAHEPGAEDAGADADLVLRAGAAAELHGAAPGPAEAAGIVRRSAGRIRFDTPGLRDALYTGAMPARRRAAHRLLASVLDDGRTPPLLRQLHRALAAEGPDAPLAAALSSAADAPGTAPHAQRAAALSVAADLTRPALERALRRAAAARHARLAGLPGPARDLLGAARSESADARVRGAVELVRGQLALADGPVADAHEALVLAAELLAPHDPDGAREARLCAMAAAWDMGDAAAYLSALGAPPEDAAPGPRAAGADILAEEYRAAMSDVMRGRLGAASLGLRGVVARGQGADEPTRLLRAGVAALVVGDLAAASRVNARALAAARARGMDIHVPQALEYLAYAELRAGRHARARAHAEEGLRTAGRTGQRNIAAQHHAILALVASVEGEDEAVTAHAAAAARTAHPHGLAQAATLAQWALARVDLSRGRAPEAAARLGPVVRPGPRRGHFAVRMLAVPCFVEASFLIGEGEAARDCVAEFAAWAAQGADPQAPAQLARCHALLAGPDECDALYTVALARHALVGGDFESARTQLLYGKWLRRRRRPGEARGLLRDALVSFERCGARAWAGQARAELRATGEARTAEPPGGLSLLTPQQLRIARCVAEGATNREVARCLSLSPRTVDHHLRNVFALLGVRSRVELSRLVARSEQHTTPDEP
ncbi:LuxR family transcriptional regulator [Streptomyces alboniger]|uniref:Helix-turn-helix transcriptional regulator n=1 Tax=Streptomyces alboniger TaxID=132473 RepID=A0A5J6HUM7_STRAD|nr:LuxR family transcriptional regulator [Streptomyces alboniger]QEV22031.1 helix-turn-helix transcriptional regulator [Streptomyces alboniger]